VDIGWGLRPRLAVLVAATGTLVAAAALGGLVLAFGHELDASVDEGLRARASDLVASTVDGDLTASHDDPFAQLIARNGRVVAGSVNAPATSVLDAAELQKAARRPLTVEATVPALRGAARLQAEPAGRYVVVVGTGLAEFDSARRRFLVLLGGSLVLLVAMLTVGAWFLVGAALRPVARLSLAAEAMSGSDPHGQLPLAGGHDELALLGRTLNGLLDRIGAFLDRERAFLEDASHELRTPLTVLRGELELALEDPDQQRAWQGVRSALVEAEGLSALASDLLVLARQRGEGLTLDRTEVPLAGWLAATVDGLGHTLGLDVVFAVDGDVSASVDTARMERVLINLLNNAAAAGATQVRISVSFDSEGTDDKAGPRETLLEVADDGPGFDPAVLPRAFERFARADGTRSDPAGGSGAGLGLAIVAAIVDAHGGTVTADNESVLGGARLRIRLPG
jgi:two-component system, OmpR family, sensor kinase